MRIEGRERIALPRDVVWRRLNDPEVLRACTPGLERLEESSPDRFEGSLRVQVPALTGRFDGTLEVVERREPERLRLRLAGKGGPGFVDGEATLHLSESEGGTEVRYEADLQVGGQVARLGQRMVSGITREMAGQFFETFQRRGAAGAEGAVRPRNPVWMALQLAWRTLLNLLGLSRRS